MADLGQAYVQILPKATGIKGAIEKQMSPEADAAGSKAGGLFSGKFKSVIIKAALGAAVFKGIASSMKQGAELQQSLGGIETLYKGSADIMKKYANEAYKSVGVSANEYMQNVTSFSAGLIASVGGNTKKAAKTANMAMIDMSDNANKMGTNIEDLQNAYQGFAKQNYTMLDNLKLGYGGTKTEMERLLKDAQKLTGEKYDISNLNDVYKAIHAIQKDLDITGTTAKEAEHTFSGSFNAMKAAASDLLGNLAIGGDVEQPLKNLVSTAKTFLVDNFLPMLENIVDQLPMILEGLSDAITPMMPTLIDAGVQITSSIVQGLIKSAPLLVDGLFQVVKAAFEALKEVDWKALGAQVLNQIKESFSANPAAMVAVMAPIGLKMGKSLLGGLTSALGGSGGISSIIGKVLGTGSAANGATGAGGFLGDPAKTAKGLGSIAIILGGVTAIVEAYGALNKIPGIQEFTAGGGELLKKVFDAIGKIATPQTAGIIAATEVLGAVGPGIAASGIGSLAILIGGLTAIVEAFGALDKIPGIEKFTEGGGELLSLVMEQIGKAVASLAKGFAVEITSALPEIGANLAGFANSAKPFFDMCASADFSGMDGFADGLMALVKADLGNKLSEFLFGSGYSFEEIGQELSKFADAMIDFFASAGAVGSDLQAGIDLLQAASNISELVTATKDWEAGWGEADLPGLGKALTDYATNIIPFFEAAAQTTANMDAGVKLMSISGDITKLVKAAQVKDDIGTAKFTSLANALTEYAQGMDKFFKTATNIGDLSAGLTLADKSAAFSKLANAAKDYKSGSLATLGLDLLKFSANYKAFSENMSGLGEVDVSGAVNSISKLTSSAKSGGDALAKTVAGMSGSTSSAFSKLKNTFTSGGNSIAKAADFSGKVKTAMGKVNTAVTSAKGTIKKSLDGLKKTFSDTKFKLNTSLKLPHFSMSGDFDAKTKKVPKVNVSWYAKGGIATSPLIGFGEAGAEALLPLDPFWKRMDDLADNLQGGNTYNITLNANGGEDPEQYAQRFARELHRQVRMGTI